MFFLFYRLKNCSQLAVPFCAFFTTFTIVMTILVLSTDFKGHHFHFNSTNIWPFEDLYQDSPYLINIIRNEFIKGPGSKPPIPIGHSLSMTLSQSVFSLIGRTKRGIFIECGGRVDEVKSGTEYLENKLSWSGLVTQPHPGDFKKLVSSFRPRSYKANICISPTTNPKHALFRDSSVSVSNRSVSQSLTTIPCFPLYSLMIAFNATTVDLLVLNSVPAELQVLKTLPFNKLIISVIMIINKEINNPCCDETFLGFMSSKHFQQLSDCPLTSDRCAFSCSLLNFNCPLSLNNTKLSLNRYK